jgi:hypothetical protein
LNASSQLLRRGEVDSYFWLGPLTPLRFDPANAVALIPACFNEEMTMSRLNVPALAPLPYERGPAHTMDAGRQLRRSVSTCLLWENRFYETGNEIANRIAELVPQVEAQQVADLATEAVIGSSCVTCPCSFSVNWRGELAPRDPPCDCYFARNASTASSAASGFP